MKTAFQLLTVLIWFMFIIGTGLFLSKPQNHNWIFTFLFITAFFTLLTDRTVQSIRQDLRFKAKGDQPNG